MESNIYVIMPAYNAGRTIEGVFQRIPESARRRIKKYIVVDDGSTDDTAQALQRLKSTVPGLQHLTHTRNKGYGAAEKTLLNSAISQDVDIAILLHSDGQYSPEKILDVIRPIELGEADIVQGSRMLGGGALKGGMPLYKYLSNKCLTALENWAFGLKLAEYHSGYMVYSKKALSLIPYQQLSDSFDFDLEMIVMAKVKGLRVAEVAIPTIYGDEVSYLNPIKYGLDVLSVIMAYRRGQYHAI